MPLSVIAGTYKIVGASPDGDSVRFYPTDPDAWSKAGIKAKPNAHGGVQLRLDAIDALETHYTPPHAAHAWRQPKPFGDGAAAELLRQLGFTSVTRDDRGYVTAATPAERPGYILTRFADVYGRAVSLAYPGSRRGRTGADGTARIEVAELRRSVNYRLLAAGWVYPTFYSKLYVDFRDALAAATVKARDAGTGLWAEDVTNSGFPATSAAKLTDDVVIMPKLFRRLAEFLTDAGTGTPALSGFHRFLSAHDDDKLFTVPAGQATNLDTLVAISRTTVKLTVPPEQIVFQED
jgi:endonuclease YncB( thermonuclease family)